MWNDRLQHPVCEMPNLRSLSFASCSGITSVDLRCPKLRTVKVDKREAISPDLHIPLLSKNQSRRESSEDKTPAYPLHTLLSLLQFDGRPSDTIVLDEISRTKDIRAYPSVLDLLLRNDDSGLHVQLVLVLRQLDKHDPRPLQRYMELMYHPRHQLFNGTISFGLDAFLSLIHI